VTFYRIRKPPTKLDMQVAITERHLYNFTGTREEAVTVARRKIDNWLNEQKRKALRPKRLGLKPGR
jgi:hypothetical protein